MECRTERAAANLAFGVLLFAWFGLILLWYYVPRLAAQWARTGVELSRPARMLVQLGHFAGHGFWVAGLLLVVTGAAVAWRITAIRKTRQARTE